MVKNRLAQSDAQTKGWLLDGRVRLPPSSSARLRELRWVRTGSPSDTLRKISRSRFFPGPRYPRSESQGTALEQAGIHPELFIVLNVSWESGVGSRSTAGRAAD